MKIEMKLAICKACGKIVNLKKEKQGKGLPPLWYCPKCAANN